MRKDLRCFVREQGSPFQLLLFLIRSLIFPYRFDHPRPIRKRIKTWIQANYVFLLEYRQRSHHSSIVYFQISRLSWAEVQHEDLLNEGQSKKTAKIYPHYCCNSVLVSNFVNQDLQKSINMVSE